MPHAKYDPEADILYVQLRDSETPATQKFLDDLRILDYSADGAVVGVEFICASDGIDLERRAICAERGRPHRPEWALVQDLCLVELAEGVELETLRRLGEGLGRPVLVGQ